MVNITIGSTHIFKLKARKDGVDWPLTNATVILTLETPNGTQTNYTASVSGNVATYFSPAIDRADADGEWVRAWKITDGSVVQVSLPIKFKVTKSP